MREYEAEGFQVSDHSELKKVSELAIQAGIENEERWPTADDWFEPDLVSAEMAYVKAASPAVVLGLIAELEVSNNVGRALGETLGSVVDSRDALVRVVDQLKAENEVLREDLEHARRQPLYSTRLAADRYRWLREQFWGTSPIAVVVNPKNSVKLGHEYPSGIRLDHLIDSMRLVVSDD